MKLKFEIKNYLEDFLQNLEANGSTLTLFPKFVSHSGDRWNQIFASLTQTYHKLTKLGFTYYNGKVAIIESSEEDSNV